MDLEECLLITDATLIHLAMGCPRLEKLVSTHCGIVSVFLSHFIFFRSIHLIYGNMARKSGSHLLHSERIKLVVAVVATIRGFFFYVELEYIV